jgi:predicted nucleic acid-binding protein
VGRAGQRRLVLDSEALFALANTHVNKYRSEKVLSFYRVALEKGRPVVVPPLVVAELCRGQKYDPAILRAIYSFSLLVPDLDIDQAVEIGNLLGKAKKDSAHMVDAAVVCTASHGFASEIMTGDFHDIEELLHYIDNSTRVIKV